MRDYFKKKSDAIDGKKEGSEEAKKICCLNTMLIRTFESILEVILSIKPTGL
jgi:hypothetical protein